MIGTGACTNVSARIFAVKYALAKYVPNARSRSDRAHSTGNELMTIKAPKIP